MGEPWQTSAADRQSRYQPLHSDQFTFIGHVARLDSSVPARL